MQKISQIMFNRIVFTSYFILTILSFGSVTAISQTTLTAQEVSAKMGEQKPNDPRNDPTPNGKSNIKYRMSPMFGISDGEFRRLILKTQIETQLKVFKILDGNTLQVGNSKGKQIVRILGVDAPELEQTGGKEAQTKLSELVLNKSVVLKYSSFQPYDDDGVYLARVFLNEKDIGRYLLENGFAWFDDAYKYFFSKDDAIENASAQVQAQAAKLGIWSETKPQKPWEYREETNKEITKAKKRSGKN